GRLIGTPEDLAMAALTFRFELDPATGLPRLTDPAGALAPGECESLQRELSAGYARLVGLDRRTVRLRTRLAAAGGRGRVRLPVLPGRDRRCPTLVLTALAPAAPAAAAPPRGAGVLAPLEGLRAGPLLANPDRG